uniref:Uncharacterized protein n=1 Tax=Arundo donax TaxID=35708 RepID=A0A0A8YRT4_ARUDO
MNFLHQSCFSPGDRPATNQTSSSQNGYFTGQTKRSSGFPRRPSRHHKTSLQALHGSKPPQICAAESN